jgi:hypothetical protein
MPMRFLCPTRQALPLSLSLVGLIFPALPAPAADETSTRVVVSGEEIVDMAKVHSGGQIVFVSSGQKLAVSHAIDDDRRTIFQFSNSDPRPTLLVKLNETRPVQRVSLVPGSAAPRVNVYLLDELPRTASDLDALKPLTSIVNLVVGREASAEFAPQNARYVALRWVLANPAAGPVKVAEVSAFAQTDSRHVSDLLAAAAPADSFQVVEPPDVSVVSQ